MDNGILTPGFLSRAERIQASPNPDQATGETVAVMCRNIHRSAADPLIQRYAIEAVNTFGLPANLDAFQDANTIAWSVWWFAKHALRFEHHHEQIWTWFKERDQLQLLIEPSVLVRMQQWRGDCAIYTMLICAMLEVLKVPFEICTIACDRRQPNIFTHVFPRVILANGQRETLDASHGSGPGWQVPARDTYRMQVFDSWGNAIPDQQGFSGLHGYVNTPDWESWGVSGRTGLGCGCSDIDPDTGICNDPDPCPPATPSCSSTQVLVNGICTDVTIPGTAEGSGTPTGVTTYTCPSGQSMVNGVCTDPSTGGYVAPSGGNSSAAWAAFAAQLAKSGMTLAEINAIQPGTVVSANGTILRQAAGYPVSAAGTSLTAALGASGISTPMLFLGLGVIALVLMTKK